jgi:hypothetical protein
LGDILIKPTVASQHDKLILLRDFMHGDIGIRRDNLLVRGERVVLFELKVAQGPGEGEVP